MVCPNYCLHSHFYCPLQQKAGLWIQAVRKSSCKHWVQQRGELSKEERTGSRMLTVRASSVAARHRPSLIASCFLCTAKRVRAGLTQTGSERLVECVASGWLLASASGVVLAQSSGFTAKWNQGAKQLILFCLQHVTKPLRPEQFQWPTGSKATMD